MSSRTRMPAFLGAESGVCGPATCTLDRGSAAIVPVRFPPVERATNASQFYRFQMKYGNARSIDSFLSLDGLLSFRSFWYLLCGVVPRSSRGYAGRTLQVTCYPWLETTK